MFDFIKNMFSSLTQEQVPTPKAVRQAQIKTMTISNESLKKDIGEDGLSKIISNVKYELYALYPDIRIDENLLKELVRSIAFAEPRSEAVLDTIQSVLPDLPKKTVMEYTGNISSLSSFHRDAVRSQKNGTEWYVWKPSCKVHQHMKEVFIRWDSPLRLNYCKTVHRLPITQVLNMDVIALHTLYWENIASENTKHRIKYA